MNRSFPALIASALIVAGCSSGAGSPEQFTGTVQYYGNTDRMTVESQSCEFAGGTVTAGDQVEMRGEHDQSVAMSKLTSARLIPNDGPSADGVCSFEARFLNVPATEAAYRITLGEFETEVFTESELTAGAAVQLKSLIEDALGR
ncbi:hypothetical protein E4P29_25390 [Rhodococcus sp. 1R11]|uniref:hypothetical protein n=1 Tax=Rhodococcus sp. 1R11 TaxID=2559614 RepID=UPI001071660B|nr:hypothetical protein [Rhodococcus sp. 1R11]TFI40248.1 hypothetical protein E4P29_25390 [Rhodococcus sp. 1R11]